MMYFILPNAIQFCTSFAVCFLSSNDSFLHFSTLQQRLMYVDHATSCSITLSLSVQGELGQRYIVIRRSRLVPYVRTYNSLNGVFVLQTIHSSAATGAVHHLSAVHVPKSALAEA